jgi:serine phosphatase RsbU (regulator of sigma subunit)
MAKDLIRFTSQYGPLDGPSTVVIDTLPPHVEMALAKDPSFALVTADGHWVDPYTGELTPLEAGDRLATARVRLRQHRAWATSRPRARDELALIRWRHDLLRMLRTEPRLRLFTRSGRWVNPFTGELVEGVRREEGRITALTVLDLTRVLAACPAAESGRLLEMDYLHERCVQRRLDAEREAGESPPQVALNDSTGSVRRSRASQRLLSVSPPAMPGCTLAVRSEARDEVGGDFCTVLIMADSRRVLLVGDVSGHGADAALVATATQAALRHLAPRCTELLELLIALNEALRGDLDAGRFVTVFAAAFNPDSDTLTCLCAGHHPALLFPAHPGDALVRRVGAYGMAIGLAPTSVFAASLKAVQIPFGPGDLLVQYTDGISEAGTDDGHEFGENGLAGTVLNLRHGTPQMLVDAVVAAARNHAAGELADDTTMVALTREPR